MQRSDKFFSLTSEDLAFSKLLCYAAYQYPSYRINHHHRIIADALEKVERGDILRLMISVPPRHGKSMIASEFFPAWYLGRNPDKYIIASSYGQELSDDFGRKVKNQILNPEFSNIFPGCKMADDSTASRRFNTASGGAYFAVGVGGAVTGRGANVLIVDDPVKNREEADSDTIRRKVWDWFTSTAYTRLMPNGAIVVIMTRWHESDLGGMILNNTNEKWHVIKLPALNENGDALWPEQYSKDDLLRIKDTIGQRDWEALYQQNPSPREGGFFKPEMIKVIEAIPTGGQLVRKWDLAATAGGGDYTVGLLYSSHGVIADIVRLRGDGQDVERAILNTAMRDGKEVAIHLSQDPGQAGKAQVAYLTNLLAGYRVVTERESGDKETRAMPVSSQVNVGNISMVRASWNHALIEEMRMFPNGANDDQIDALSGAFNHMVNNKPVLGVRRL